MTGKESALEKNDYSFESSSEENYRTLGRTYEICWESLQRTLTMHFKSKTSCNGNKKEWPKQTSSVRVSNGFLEPMDPWPF